MLMWAFFANIFLGLEELGRRKTPHGTSIFRRATAFSFSSHLVLKATAPFPFSASLPTVSKEVLLLFFCPPLLLALPTVSLALDRSWRGWAPSTLLGPTHEPEDLQQGSRSKKDNSRSPFSYSAKRFKYGILFIILIIL